MTDFDDVMRALSDDRRRRILIELRREEAVDPFSGVGDGREGALRLHHEHLPLLADDDLITWDRDTGIVRRGENFETAEPVLAALEAHRDTLPDDYLPTERLRC